MVRACAPAVAMPSDGNVAGSTVDLFGLRPNKATLASASSGNAPKRKRVSGPSPVQFAGTTEAAGGEWGRLIAVDRLRT